MQNSLMMKVTYIILLVFISLSLSATNIHVATSGDDSNGDGSINNPYATLEYGANIAQPGDTVFVHGGTYRNSDFADGDIWTGETLANISSHGEEGAYIVIQPYDNESVVFEFDGNYGILFSTASYIKFDGFEVKGVADMIYQKEAEDAWGLYKDKDDADYPNTVHNLLDSMTVTDGGTEIIDSITNPKIQGLVISKQPMANIVKPAHYNGRGIVANTSHHIIISNNIVRDVPSSAIRVQGSDFVSVENNEVYHNTYWTTLGVGAITVAEATVLDGDTSDDIKIKLINNRVYQNENRMISWNPSKDIVNFIIDEGTGLFLTRNNETYSNGRMLIANNLSYQNGASGIVCHYTDHVIIEQNSVYDNGTTNDGTPGGIGVNTSDDVIIRNNISYSKENKWALGVLALPITNLVCENNIVFNNSGSEDVISNTDVFDTGYTEVDPLFIDVLNFNFHLSSLSPAIDAGSLNTLQTTDIEGNLRNDGSPDIGAFEYSPNNPAGNVLVHYDFEENNRGSWSGVNSEIVSYEGSVGEQYMQMVSDGVNSLIVRDLTNIYPVENGVKGYKFSFKVRVSDTVNAPALKLKVTTADTSGETNIVAFNNLKLTTSYQTYTAFYTTPGDFDFFTLLKFVSSTADKYTYYIDDFIIEEYTGIYSKPITISMVDSLYTYSIDTVGIGDLQLVTAPDWLSLSGGVLSGVPDKIGTYHVMLVYANDIQEFEISVVSTPKIVSSPITEVALGREYVYNVDTIGLGELKIESAPNWLTLSDGVLSGTPDTSGTVTVILSYATDTQAFDIVVVEDVSSGNEQLLSYEIVLYPNPATNFISIANIQGDAIILLYDMSGREVRRISSNDNKCTINTSEIKSGIYIINIKTDKVDNYSKIRIIH